MVWKRAGPLVGPRENVFCVSVHPSQHIVACANQEGHVFKFSLDDPTIPPEPIWMDEYPALRVTWSGDLLAAGFEDGSLRILDENGDEVVTGEMKCDDQVYGLAMTQDGVVLGGAGNCVKIWNIHQSDFDSPRRVEFSKLSEGHVFGGLARNPNADAFVFSLSLVPSSPELVACALSDGTIRIFDQRVEQQRNIESQTTICVNNCRHAVTSISFCRVRPSQQLVAATTSSGMVFVFDLRNTSTPIFSEQHSHESPLYDVNWIDDRILTVGSDKWLRESQLPDTADSGLLKESFTGVGLYCCDVFGSDCVVFGTQKGVGVWKLCEGEGENENWEDECGDDEDEEGEDECGEDCDENLEFEHSHSHSHSHGHSHAHSGDAHGHSHSGDHSHCHGHSHSHTHTPPSNTK